MATGKVMYLLGFSVAVALAAIVYIIVDKTSYCRTGTPTANTAVSYDDGTVVCLPGYVFSDGLSSHQITCDSPPYWNWNSVPECIKVNETVAWKCRVQSNETELVGDILIFQSDPTVAVRVQGELVGLKSSSIQVIDVEDTNKTCHITNELGLPGMQTGTIIDGNIFRINETLSNPMIISETFQFYIRAIGSQHVQQQRAEQFNGVAVFVLEQNKKTVGIFSASSPA